MSVFLLSLDITRNIEKSLTKFWWSTAQNNKSKINWMGWDRMTKHKNAGGMGFRHFRDFNMAMLGKQLWKLATDTNSLVSRMYKAKYFANTDIFQASIGHNPSFIWRSLLEAKQMIFDGFRWRVGDGNDIRILDQPWLLDKGNPFITSDPEPLKEKKVMSLMRSDKKEWDLEVLQDVLNERDQSQVLNITLYESNQEDKIFWLPEESGIYSVKSAYRFLQAKKGDWNVEENDRIWRDLWSTRAPPKTLNLTWRALSDCLPSLVQLQLKRVPIHTLCPVCQEEEESTLHSLVLCNFARQCWWILLPGVQFQETMSFKSWLSFIFNTVDKEKHAEVITLCWSIWRSRNDLV